MQKVNFTCLYVTQLAEQGSNNILAETVIYWHSNKRDTWMEHVCMWFAGYRHDVMLLE